MQFAEIIDTEEMSSKLSKLIISVSKPCDHDLKELNLTWEFYYGEYKRKNHQS